MSNSSVAGSVEGETLQRFLGPDDLQPVRRNFMTTPMANQPCENSRRRRDFLRRNEEPQVVLANGEDARAGGFRTGGDPSEEDRQRATLGGHRAPRRGIYTDRDVRSMPAPDASRFVHTLSGPVGDSGVLPNMTPARKYANAINIPGFRGPSHFRHWKLSFHDNLARCPRPT